jgi:nitrate reductase gamma subunit
MQFGKLHGLALAILGAILLGFQAMLSITPNNLTSGATESSTVKVEHRTIPVAGILGVVCFIAGVGIFVTRRKADEPEKKYAVK